MAAWDHVSAAARMTTLRNLRAAFLANPAAYQGGDFNLGALLGYSDKVYVSASASGGAGTIGNPYDYVTWRTNQRANSLVIATGNFRGDRFQFLAGTQTLDLRNATLSPGKTIPGGSIINVSGNKYKVVDTSLVDFTSTYLSVVVRQFDQNAGEWLNYYGLSQTQSGDAGHIMISSSATNGDITVAAPWALSVNDKVAFMPTTNYPDGTGGLAKQTTYWVVLAGSFNTTSGVQTIRLSLTQGGAAITFSAGQVTAMAGGSGSNKMNLWSLYEGHTTTGIPQIATQAAGEFSYSPQTSELYFTTLGPLTGDYEVIVTSAQKSGVDKSNYSGIHVIGGTILGTHRAVLRSGGSSNYEWGVKFCGSYRGIASSGGETGSGSRYCEGISSRYNFSSEGPSDAETYTDHRWFIARDSSNRVIHCDDRQAGMVNPGSDNSIFTDFLFYNCGLVSYGGMTPPANQVSPITSTWGVLTDDSSSNFTVQRGYFARCYGEMIKINAGTQGIANVLAEDVIFDNRETVSGDVKGQTGLWCFAKAASGAITNVVMNRPITLAGVMQQPLDNAGRKSAANIFTGISQGGLTVNTKIRDGYCYGGSGAESVNYLLTDEASANPDSVINLDVDRMFYCNPSVTYHVAKVGTPGGAWSTLGTLKSSIAMPVAPGVVTPWTSGTFTNNDANSVVLTEAQMTVKGLLYGADGYVLPVASSTFTKRPGWTGKQR